MLLFKKTSRFRENIKRRVTKSISTKIDNNHKNRFASLPLSHAEIPLRPQKLLSLLAGVGADHDSQGDGGPRPAEVLDGENVFAVKLEHCHA